MVLKLILIFIMLYVFVYMPYINSNNKSVHVVPIYGSSYYEPVIHRYGYYSYPRSYTYTRNVRHHVDNNVHHVKRHNVSHSKSRHSKSRHNKRR
jgi:hypothetical protein